MKRFNRLLLTIALLLTVCNGSFAQLPGYALQFDGVNDYVDLPESAPLTTNFSNQITIEAWIYSDNYLNASVIASGNQNDYALAVLTDGRLRVDMYGIDITGIGAFFSKSLLAANLWYHIAVRYNGSTETILINGQVDTTRSASGNFATSPQSEDIRIGSYSGSGPNFFRGIIDEVRIWNVARTQSEIQQTMNDTLIGSESGLVGYWRFDEGLGTTTVDGTSNGNTGTLVNNPTWVSLGALPIQLASFNAFVLTQTRVSLQWRTLSELNNFGFDIQRRQSVQPEFQTLPNSFVPGHGTTNVPQYYSFLDATVFVGSWQYRLKQIDLDGTVHYTDPIQVNMVTSVNSNSTPTEFSLDQNYPNPFNPSTTIRFQISNSTFLTLKVLDVLGREVATIVDGFLSVGNYTRTFDASTFSSGVYLYRLSTEGFTQTRRLTLIK